MTQPSKTALVLIFEGVEEIEALTPVDLLRRASVDVTVVSMETVDFITGRNGIRIVPDATLSDLDPLDFDLFILPGGPGVLELEENPQLREMLQKRDAAQNPIAAICAAPKVLASAGILNDRQATSHGSVRANLPKASDQPVIKDGHIVTSQGVGTAIAFSLTLIEWLVNAETSQTISDSIHA